MAERILVVEDEAAIADAVAYQLTGEGFNVHVVSDGESALRVAFDDFDLIVLDQMLPKLSSLEVCRRVRSRSIVPILILTARTGELDRVLGLDAGADDYVTKPFSSAELVSRIRAILRRRDVERSTQHTTLVVGDLELDLSREELTVEGRPVELTQSEFRLLALLAHAPERVFTRRELVQHLWHSSHLGDERTCDVRVMNLRRKIERDPARPERLVTVRGVGYLFRA
ncbi:MAG TPA: response regulator transcription factor [Gaiellaceae bacterium]|nr:response regulator transcription factor [Gaiellaceae bacterium]